MWHEFERLCDLFDTELPWNLIIRDSHKKCRISSMPQLRSERKTHIAVMEKRMLEANSLRTLSGIGRPGSVND